MTRITSMLVFHSLILLFSITSFLPSFLPSFLSFFPSPNFLKQICVLFCLVLLESIVSNSPADRFSSRRWNAIEAPVNGNGNNLTLGHQRNKCNNIVTTLVHETGRLIASLQPTDSLVHLFHAFVAWWADDEKVNRRTYIRVSCRPWGTSLSGTLDISAACTYRSRNRCHTCTDTRRSWLYSAGRNL